MQELVIVALKVCSKSKEDKQVQEKVDCQEQFESAIMKEETQALQGSLVTLFDVGSPEATYVTP